MERRYMKEHHENHSILSPWETENQESSINKYCSDYVQSWKFTQKEKNLPKINQKKRAISTCSNIRKRQKTHQVELSEKHTELKEKMKICKPQSSTQNQNQQRHFHTISQQRTDRLERKKIDRPNILQEISVKNFIIEGGQEKPLKNDKCLKKRQSSYVMKQKFAEFRRSTKEMLIQNKQNTNMRVIRYEN